MNKLHRLIYTEPGRFLNPLAQIFIFINLIEGVAFTFFSHTAAVQSIILSGIIGSHVLPVWGVSLLILSLLNILTLVTRKHYIGRITSFVGFMVWTFATVVYLQHGFYLQMIIHPIPQVVFWVWYYFALKRYTQPNG